MYFSFAATKWIDLFFIRLQKVTVSAKGDSTMEKENKQPHNNKLRFVSCKQLKRHKWRETGNVHWCTYVNVVAKQNEGGFCEYKITKAYWERLMLQWLVLI